MYDPVDEGIIHQEISEFSSLQKTEYAVEEDIFLNSRPKTLALIEAYKKYKTKLGSYELKSMKRLWEVVARELSNIFKITISASKCENRWKTLERNYKKVVDNNNKTGRPRRIFEYEEEFDEIYARKKNITSSILLSSSSVIPCSSRENACSETFTNQQLNLPEGEQPNVETPVLQIREKVSATPTNPSIRRKQTLRRSTSSYKKRNEILLEMKNDLKKYYEEKSVRDERRLQLEIAEQEDRVRRTNILASLIQSIDSQERSENTQA